MRGIRLQPLMDKAIPFLCYRLGAQVVWCRYNLTRSLEPTPEMPNPSGEMARLIKGLYLNVPLNLAVIKGRVLMVQKSSYPVEVGSLSKSLQGFIHQVVQDFFHQHCFLIGRVAYLATDYPRIRVSRFRPKYLGARLAIWLVSRRLEKMICLNLGNWNKKLSMESPWLFLDMTCCLFVFGEDLTVWKL